MGQQDFGNFCYCFAGLRLPRNFSPETAQLKAQIPISLRPASSNPTILLIGAFRADSPRWNRI